MFDSEHGPNFEVPPSAKAYIAAKDAFDRIAHHLVENVDEGDNEFWVHDGQVDTAPVDDRKIKGSLAEGMDSFTLNYITPEEGWMLISVDTEGARVPEFIEYAKREHGEEKVEAVLQAQEDPDSQASFTRSEIYIPSEGRALMWSEIELMDDSLVYDEPLYVVERFRKEGVPIHELTDEQTDTLTNALLEAKPGF